MVSRDRTEGPWQDFFHLVGLQRIPLFLSAFAAFIFALPDQSIDCYISIAQNLRLTKPWAHLTDARVATAVVLLAGLLAVAVLGATLWVVSHALLETNSHDHGRWVRKFKQWVLPFVVVLPAIGLTLGTYQAALLIPDAKITAALMAARDVPPDMVQDIVMGALDPTLPRVVAAMAGALALLLIVVIVSAETWCAKSVRKFDFTRIGRRLLPVALLIMLLITVAAWSVRTAQVLGSVAIFALFMAGLTLLCGAVDRYSRMRGIPILSLIVVWAIALAATGINDNHQMRLAYEARPGALGPTRMVGDAFKEWYDSRTDKSAYLDRGQRYPVYVVAAQGGGIYAAYHAAAFLAGTQDECPLFRKHLFAISSVSGGSVGAAVFHSLLKGEPSVPGNCSDLLPPTLSDRAERILSPDFLSPLVAAFLVPDFFQRFLPASFPQLDRARALERALEDSFAKISTVGANPFAARLADHWQASRDEPALLMGTTEVGSGRLRVISPFALPSKDIKLLGLDDGYDRLSVSTAAVLSARFPWITPAAWFNERTTVGGQPHITKIRLVDGGIFENSGVAIALEVMRALEREAAKSKILDKIDLNLIVLTDGEGVTATFPRFDFGEFLDPIRAFLSTRSARAPLTIAQAERELDDKTQPEYAGFRMRPTRVRRVPLESLGVKLPLGWYLSHTAMLMINAQTGDHIKCSPALGYKQGEPNRFDADCVSDLFFQELNGTLMERLKVINPESSAPR